MAALVAAELPVQPGFHGRNQAAVRGWGGSPGVGALGWELGRGQKPQVEPGASHPRGLHPAGTPGREQGLVLLG